MPAIRRQQYTLPIPADATRTTMKIKRHGATVEVAAVRIRGRDGRTVTAPVVEGGKSAGKSYRVESPYYYATVRGRPVRLETTREGSEKKLARLILEAEQDAGPNAKAAKARRQTLAEHVDAFEGSLAAAGWNAFDTKQTAARVRKALLDGCDFDRLADLDAERVAGWLAEQTRDGPRRPVPAGPAEFTVRQAAELLGVTTHAVHAAMKRLGIEGSGKGRRSTLPRDALQGLLDRKAQGMSEQTAAHYRKALCQFGNWLASSKRLNASPFDTLPRRKVATSRHARRPLTTAELRRLLEAAGESARTFRGLSGADRRVLYATAYYTAFRAGGLASLTPECFDLDGPVPAVTLPVRGDKVKSGLVNAMPPDLIAALRSWLATKPRRLPVWPGTWASDKKAASMLRADLQAAGIPYVIEGPDGPEHADFHALRHTTITTLRRSGGDLRAQQEMAGHSSPVVTAKYSHVDLVAKAEEVNRLPSILSGGGPE